MSFVSVCDAWMTELTTNVAALSTVPAANQHKYAPWSLENLFGSVGERHLAIWPVAQQPAPDPFTTKPGDYVATTYAVIVWEDASTDAVRAQDDDTANQAWLNLTAAIEARYRVTANMALGETGAITRLGTLAWGLHGTYRTIELQFTVAVPVDWT